MKSLSIFVGPIIIAMASGVPAHAQEEQVRDSGSTNSRPPIDPEKPASLPVAPAPGVTTPPDVIDETDPYAQLNDLNPKGWAVPFPAAQDTVLGDAGGFRSALAEQGLGVNLVTGAAVQYDVRQDDNGYKGPPLYNGHKKVARVVSFATMYLTSDLGKIGLEGGQLIFDVTASSNSLRSINGPNYVTISGLSYYQSLFSENVQIRAGIFDNSYDYIGTNVAGSVVAGTLGPNAIVPYQTGISYLGASAPGLNVKVNLGSGFYNRAGIQRSLPPGGAPAELAVDRAGLKLSVKGTRILYLNELGYNRAAAPGTKSRWIRVGGLINPTRYARFDGSGTQANWSGWAAADLQITQPEGNVPSSGIYAGATVHAARSSVNVFNNYVEGRVYGIGLIKDWPFDLMSIVASRSHFSTAFRDSVSPFVGEGYRTTTSVIGSYAYRIAAGTYLQPGVGVTFNPTSAPKVGTAVNAYLSATVIF